jgi:hypothetical protein
VREFNKDHAVWAVKEINKRKGTPHHMANEELADDIFPFIRDQFPEAIMVKLGIGQFITVSKRGQNALIKRLKSRKEAHEKDINELNYAIELCSQMQQSTRP